MKPGGLNPRTGSRTQTRESPGAWQPRDFNPGRKRDTSSFSCRDIVQ